MPRSPFIVIPWEEDFLSSLLSFALEETDGDIGRAEFIFPHSRPKRYLSLLLQQNKDIKRPLIMPGMHTVSALFTAASGRIASRPAWTAGLLDRVGILLRAAREESGQDSPFFSDAKSFFPWGVRLAALFEECFIQGKTAHDFQYLEGEVTPFAALLLRNLSRIFNRYERDLTEKEWTTPGLDAFITARWLQQSPLPEGVLRQGEDRVIIIAGFHALTGTEDALFSHLWQERSARIVLHADKKLAENAAPHWSCRILTAWAKQWNAQFLPYSTAPLQPTPAIKSSGPQYSLPLFAENPMQQAQPGPSFKYFAGFDLHSQLAALQEQLTDITPQEAAPPHSEELLRDKLLEDDEAAFAEQEQLSLDHQADTVIVLPDSGLLLPALHHLPHVDVNISMGYPLARSPLFRLIDTLLRLQEGRKGNRYYWRDLIDLIRHPYLKMLVPASSEKDAHTAASGKGTGSAALKHDTAALKKTTATPEKDAAAFSQEAQENASSLRRELHKMEQNLRETGKKYINPRDFFTAAGNRPTSPASVLSSIGAMPEEDNPSPAVIDLLEKLFAVTLDAFSRPERPVDMAQALEDVCSFLLHFGRPLWKRFPIDSECLHRLRHSLIPELARSALSQERFDSSTLFTLLRNLMEAERVPFEAVPLVGLQVMGMLETRLLSFRRVVVLDAVEESLPGTPDGDPLLPEALRPELGLPPLHSREQVAAYNFFRLIAGSEECLLFWQENSDAPGIQDGKKRKSRFVEELLWQEEKKRGKLFAPQGIDGPLTVIESKAAPLLRKHAAIPVTPEIRKRADDLLCHPISASLLDTYLRCPARFYYERVAMLSPASEIQDGDDPAAVGNLLHEVLRSFYEKHLERNLPGAVELQAKLGKELLRDFFAFPDYAHLTAGMPADSKAMLDAAAEKRLADYLLNQPETRVLALEKKLEADFSRNGDTWKLTGNFDRIDRRVLSFPPSDPSEEDEEAGQTAASTPEEGIVILDYKTGHIPKIAASLWDDASLWSRIALWSASGAGIAGDEQETEGPDPLLKELSLRMESVQLPFYLFLYSLAAQEEKKSGMMLSAGFQKEKGTLLPAVDAFWVTLGDQGKEISLFPQKFSFEKRQDILEHRIPDMVSFLLSHIKSSRVFRPCPGVHCNWCKNAKLCIVSAEG